MLTSETDFSDYINCAHDMNPCVGSNVNAPLVEILPVALFPMWKTCTDLR